MLRATPNTAGAWEVAVVPCNKPQWLLLGVSNIYDGPIV